MVDYICKIKQRCFELGDKPDKLLARQLKGIQMDRAVGKSKKIDIFSPTLDAY